jgi:hypothetical protein
MLKNTRKQEARKENVKADVMFTIKNLQDMAKSVTCPPPQMAA